MAKEGSVAPKERINVTFKPSTGGAQEELELPLKLMVLGDFTQRPDDRKIEDRKPIGRCMQAGKYAQQAGFADAAGAQNGDDFTLGQVEEEAFEQRVPAERSGITEG